MASKGLSRMRLEIPTLRCPIQTCGQRARVRQADLSQLPHLGMIEDQTAPPNHGRLWTSPLGPQKPFRRRISEGWSQQLQYHLDRATIFHDRRQEGCATPFLQWKLSTNAL